MSNIACNQNTLLEPANGIAVNAAWSYKDNVFEFQALNTYTRERVFYKGLFEGNFINVAQFLAIVEGLEYLKKGNSQMPLYSNF